MPRVLFVLVLVLSETVLVLEGKFQLPLKGDRLESIQALSSTRTSTSTAMLSTRKPSFYPLKYLKDQNFPSMIQIVNTGLSRAYSSPDLS
jgi:hypothetical protein